MSAADTIPFWKMHAAGNALLLFDARDGAARNWPALAIATADPHRAVGHDGILVVGPGMSPDEPFAQRMFNPDGSEDFCANGLRCTARFLYEQAEVGGEPFAIGTIAGPKYAQVLRVSAGVAWVRTELGRPELREAQELARRQDLAPHVRLAFSVSFGTPHVVLLAHDEPPEATWHRISADLEHNSGKGERLSVTWAIPDGRNRLRVRTWERAVGETLSCGTGAASALAAGLDAGMLIGPATVVSKGGELYVEQDDDGDVWLTGPAETICTGWLPGGSPEGSR
jgi:diaminopimelate epimerase